MRVKSLRIGGHRIKVAVRDLDDETKSGFFDPKTNTITVSSSLAPSQQKVTLLHEILHIINGEMEEKEVDALAQQLYQVLSDNPQLWHALTKKP